ncbi:sulfotransferase family 2 domain-containing protein [Hoeflea sp. WL0058]|uniref:Sulfotransferase family 2 domain-containing protein n=1 Tax=Flavimaribacter sediminis TaxID=2865987 RepID=A0AAE3CZY1_9HYPH|nr:sulfotransferase family 2 domain-containing protein [Flavimaribacter sediminis]MBW8636201.1 sulfotransferase family 2 domain-containing protein [Flavimaribacter sediminis]
MIYLDFLRTRSLGAVNRLLSPTGLKVVSSLKGGRWGKTRVHFLHIGKNAGTTISRACEAANVKSGNTVFVKHSHSVRLRDLPFDDPYFFSIRNPVNRFVSAFYSRKRKGMPRVHYEWSANEQAAFTRFEHADELAKALFVPGLDGAAALSAIKSISHTSMNQIDWFSEMGNFLSLRPPVHIGRQEHLRNDLEILFVALGFPMPELVEDPVNTHRTDYSSIPPLSEEGRANIERWYSQDLEFYKVCEAWIFEQSKH